MLLLRAVLPSQIQLGVPLPGHPTGDLGMIMTLSQTPCATAGACCVNGQCANWAGAHLSSNGCIHVRAAHACPSRAHRI